MPSVEFRFADDFLDYEEDLVDEISLKDEFIQQLEEEEEKVEEKTDQEKNINIRLKFALTTGQLIIQRRNFNGNFIVFSMDKKYLKDIIEKSEVLKKQMVNTYELLQALINKALTKPEVLEIIAEKNPIVVLSEQEKIAFQSSIFWSKYGTPKAFTTIRMFHKTSNAKVYFANIGENQVNDCYF